MSASPHGHHGAAPVITLTTDFGLKDGNVGALKGVIWSICPSARIADLSHLVGRQNIVEAAYLLGRSAHFFPAGTVHLIVVDPGVGTLRRPIAARIGDHYYVCPDNGLITVQLERAEAAGDAIETVELNQPEFWLPEVSDVFHGRDIFAPSAAHIAGGASLSELGSLIWDPVRLSLPQPSKTETGMQGEIIHVDHFGNLLSNVMREQLQGISPDRVSVRVGGIEIRGMVRTFGDHADGELAALLGSSGNLIIAQVNGSAADRLGARAGDRLEVLTS